jgi:hypothetical protein
MSRSMFVLTCTLALAVDSGVGRQSHRGQVLCGAANSGLTITATPRSRSPTTTEQ